MIRPYRLIPGRCANSPVVEAHRAIPPCWLSAVSEIEHPTVSRVYGTQMEILHKEIIAKAEWHRLAALQAIRKTPVKRNAAK